MASPRVMTLLLARAGGGAAVATAIALGARRARALSASGAAAAIIVGSATASAGWNWGALLVIYFVAAVLLSRLGRAEKERITGGVVAKGRERDATQVGANGGIFAALVLAGQFTSHHTSAIVAIAALGALAASAADTWATEIGTLYGGTPRSVLTLRQLPAGTSGGMSAIGSLAMLAGAGFVALVAKGIALPDAVVIVTVAGVAGALADSLVGATLQERRWCSACALASERVVHDCGVPTSLVGGREWIDNDVVNLVATIVGAAVAALLTIL